MAGAGYCMGSVHGGSNCLLKEFVSLWIMEFHIFIEKSAVALAWRRECVGCGGGGGVWAPIAVNDIYQASLHLARGDFPMIN